MPPERPTCDRVILAAGRSRRMGTAKALLRFGSATAIERVVDSGLGVVRRTVVVVAPHSGSWLDSLPRGFRSSVEWVENPRPDSEQIDSLQVGLRALATAPPAAFFVHPVDCPRVGGEEYEALLGALVRDDGEGEVFKPSVQGRHGHPVLCRWRVASALLGAAPGATARDILRTRSAVSVPVGSRAVLDDVDRPEDYRRALEEGGQDESSRR